MNGPVTRTRLVVFVGLVVERFGFGVAGDGRVDLLARHAFLDVRVVGDGLERDVRHALVDKALADVAFGLVLGRHLAGQFGFLLDALRRVGQQVVGILRGHQARARQRQGDAAGVAGDPAPAPLLGDVGRRAAAAGRVEHQVAGVGGHEEATLERLSSLFERHRPCRSPNPHRGISPDIVKRANRKVIEDTVRNADVFPMACKPIGMRQLHAGHRCVCLPTSPLPGVETVPSNLNVDSQLPVMAASLSGCRVG